MSRSVRSRGPGQLCGRGHFRGGSALRACPGVPRRCGLGSPRLTVPYHRDLDLSIARSRLLLVPTVFAGGLRLLVEEPEGVAMSYQARATGRLRVLTAGADGDRTEDRLALLLGRGRAQVVRALELPMTTTDVAEALGLAKSTVSQHLAILSGSGVVWKRRIGASVFYQLDQSGLALLRQLG